MFVVTDSHIRESLAWKGKCRKSFHSNDSEFIGKFLTSGHVYISLMPENKNCRDMEMRKLYSSALQVMS